MQYVDSSEGIRLAVHDLGGVGPDLLLSHATGFHGLVWLPMVAALRGSYHAWSLDYRGHGDSSAPADGSFAWEGFGRDTEAVIEALGLRRPAGVGHSMGATALLMAELARPGTFRALVLFEPILVPEDTVRPEGGSPLVAGARRRRASFTSRDEALENFASKPPLDVLDPAALAAYVDHGFADAADGTVRLKCEGEHEARIYEMGSQHDTALRLGELQVPVLLLASPPEPFQPSSLAPVAAGSIPGARYQCVDGMGHFGPLEDPDLLADLVDSFLADHP